MSRKRLGRGFGKALRDERGGILVTAALSMMPITMLCFAAVEFHNYSRQRADLQDALDAAALAVARAPIRSTEAQLRTLYVGVLKAHLDLRPGLVTLVESGADPVTGQGSQPSLTYASGKVTANASLRISPIIASFFVKGDLIVSGGSVIHRDMSGLEVALVLDNTGSMATNNRIGIAKEAATSFVQILQDVTGASTTAGAVKIGVVPFSSTVNVGAGNRASGVSWLDQRALSPVHDDIFHRRPAYTTTERNGGPVHQVAYPAESWAAGATNRFTLLDQLGIAWGGCVESRPMPHDVTETAPTETDPDTLFVPYFAPDEPDRVMAYDDPPDARTWWSNQLAPGMDVQAVAYPNSYVEDLRRSLAGYNTPVGNARLGAPWATFRVDRYPANPTGLLQDALGHTNGGLTDAATRAFWAGIAGTVGKYADPTGLDQSGDKGPNRGCAVRPVTRLTTNYAQVKADIQNLTIGGSTNIPMGLMWGWHLLSPNAPFGDGAAYTNRKVTKIAVLMTDGDNSMPWAGNLNNSEYSGIGYVWQNRVGTTPDTGAANTALNGRLGALCANMKARGIILYTVRVEQIGDDTLLRGCASGAAMYFDVKTAAELTATFDKIALSIQNLRIAQ